MCRALTKKKDEQYLEFDLDLQTHENSLLNILFELYVGYMVGSQAHCLHGETCHTTISRARLCVSPTTWGTQGDLVLDRETRESFVLGRGVGRVLS